MKLAGAERVVNKELGTIDYMTRPGGNNSGRELIFQTTAPDCEESSPPTQGSLLEKDRLILQLGAPEAGIAVKAAMNVVTDVRGIDLNMGCPKSFSVNQGMGAFLLKRPERVEDILKSLRRNLPESTSLSCKMRLITDERLFSPDKHHDIVRATSDFVSMCHGAGAEAVAVHMRSVPERPRDPAHWSVWTDLQDEVRRQCPNLPLIPNGDFFTPRQVRGFLDVATNGVGGMFMVARGGQWNPSIFRVMNGDADELLPAEEVAKTYLNYASRVGALWQNVKWNMQQLVLNPDLDAFKAQPVKTFMEQLNATRSMADLCKVFDASYDRPCSHPALYSVKYFRSPEYWQAAEESQGPKEARLASTAESTAESLTASKRARVADGTSVA